MTNDKEIEEIKEELRLTWQDLIKNLKLLLLLLGSFFLQYSLLYFAIRGIIYVTGLTEWQSLLILIGSVILFRLGDKLDDYCKKLSDETDTDEP
jgi:hypothetical protein